MKAATLIDPEEARERMWADFRIRCALRAMGARKFNREQWTWLERQNFFSYGMPHLFHFEKVRGIRPRLVA